MKPTRREREVLELLCREFQPKDIAAELGIALTTVYGCIQRLYGKYEVQRSHVALVCFVIRNPATFRRPVTSEKGLHPSGCPCSSPWCVALRQEAA